MLSLLFLGAVVPLVLSAINFEIDQDEPLQEVENTDDENTELADEPVVAEHDPEHSDFQRNATGFTSLEGTGPVHIELSSEYIEDIENGKSEHFKFEIGSEYGDELTFSLSPSAVEEGNFFHVLHGNYFENGNTTGVDVLVVTSSPEAPESLVFEDSGNVFFEDGEVLAEIQTFRSSSDGSVSLYKNPMWEEMSEDLSTIWGYQSDSFFALDVKGEEISFELSEDGNSASAELSVFDLQNSPGETFDSFLFEPGDATIPGASLSYVEASIPNFSNLGEFSRALDGVSEFTLELPSGLQVVELTVEHHHSLQWEGDVTQIVDYYIVLDEGSSISMDEVNVLTKELSYNHLEPGGVILGINAIDLSTDYLHIFSVPQQEIFISGTETQIVDHDISVSFVSEEGYLPHAKVEI